MILIDFLVAKGSLQSVCISLCTVSKEWTSRAACDFLRNIVSYRIITTSTTDKQYHREDCSNTNADAGSPLVRHSAVLGRVPAVWLSTLSPSSNFRPCECMGLAASRARGVTTNNIRPPIPPLQSIYPLYLTLRART
jgi:hypothetical protein